MRGVLADNNILGQFELLKHLLHAEWRGEIWSSLNLTMPAFSDLALDEKATDKDVWLACQKQQLVLITANRNEESNDSLQTTIRTLNRSDSLPVLTLADPDRVLREKTYAAVVADRIVEYLFDIDNYRGTGRLFVP